MIKPIYVPVLRAKAGEFVALDHLSEEAKAGILPLLDIPENQSKAKVPKTDMAHFMGIISSVANIWRGRPMFLDAFSLSPDKLTEDGEHVIPFFQAALEAEGVEVFPVLGYDRWDDPTYKAALSSIDLPVGRNFCLRLDDDAIADIADVEYFQDRVEDILASTGVALADVIVMIDLADLSRKVLMDIVEVAEKAVLGLKDLGFSKLILVGSSIPESINLAVKTSDTLGFLIRKEMMVWQALSSTFPSLVFGDYGVRSSRSVGEMIAPDTNGKIRYTLDGRFMISRGYSMRTRDKGAQVHGLARKILGSEHFIGSQFSWGDALIEQASLGKFTGNSTNWISIDTNHHIELVAREIVEFLAGRDLVEL